MSALVHSFIGVQCGRIMTGLNDSKQSDDPDLRFTQYRDKSSSRSDASNHKKKTSLSPMYVHPNLSIMDGDGRRHREWVINELEKIFHTYGNPIRKGSVEVEMQLYEKSRTLEEYQTLAQRLLAHFRDMAVQRQIRPSHARPSPEKPSPFTISPTEVHSPFSVRPTSSSGSGSAASATEPVTVNPFYFPPPVHVSPVQATASKPGVIPVTQRSPIQRSPIHFDAVCLPAPNKRAHLTMTRAPPRRGSLASSSGSYSDFQHDEEPEILTRLDFDEQQDIPLSHETYETSFKFLIPRNAVIKQITIHLKKTR